MCKSAHITVQVFLAGRRRAKTAASTVRLHAKGRAAVSINDINTNTWLEITNVADLSYRTAALTAPAPKRAAVAFGWDEHHERAQADR